MMELVQEVSVVQLWRPRKGGATGDVDLAGRAEDGRVVVCSHVMRRRGRMTGVGVCSCHLWPQSYGHTQPLIASLQYRDGARWVFTDQADIACTMHEAA